MGISHQKLVLGTPMNELPNKPAPRELSPTCSYRSPHIFNVIGIVGSSRVAWVERVAESWRTTVAGSATYSLCPRKRSVASSAEFFRGSVGRNRYGGESGCKSGSLP